MHRAVGASALLIALTVAPSALPGQGAVSGRVSIQERPGETTNDFGSTVIYLVPLDTASLKPKTTRTSITMSGRAFVPRVRVVTPGSRVEFPNQDPFSHNIFSSTTGATFDLGLYPAGKAKDAPPFRRPGAYPIYCNIHPRMTAFVVVAPSPWFTQAGNDGRWTITDVPAGKYTLTVWHERTDPVSHLSPDHCLVEAAVRAANDGPRELTLVPRPHRVGQP